MTPAVTQALTSLARLTLRQLRQMASDLGVTLYSRKSKDALVSEIAERQERKSGDQKAIESELSAPTRSTSSTRVVFLPRDPQWAYVVWEISDQDRKRAQTDGAAHLSLRPISFIEQAVYGDWTRGSVGFNTFRRRLCVGRLWRT